MGKYYQCDCGRKRIVIGHIGGDIFVVLLGFEIADCAAGRIAGRITQHLMSDLIIVALHEQHVSSEDADVA